MFLSNSLKNMRIFFTIKFMDGENMRVFIFGKKERKPAIYLLSALLILAILIPIGVSANSKLTPIYRVKTDENKIALTFDVAWGNDDLEEILDVLSEHEAKATFFVTGDWARRYPDGVKAIIANGHDVQNHSDTHPHVAKLSAEEIIADAAKCSNEIKSITGKETNYYRLPYGEYNNTVIESLSDYQVIQWDVDSLDWKPDATVESISERVISKTQTGSILLFHVDSKTGCTADALSQIFQKFSGKYKYVLLPELLYSEPYRIDSKGQQIQISQ